MNVPNLTTREGYVTLKEAARQFRVSYYLLHYHVVKGNLKTERIGKSHIVKKDDVENLLKTTKSRGVPRQIVSHQ
jgi:hypothetical protein